jgi:TolB-like protein
MVFLGNTSLVMAGGQTVVIHNPVVSVNSPHVVLEGSALGANAQVASVSASVGVEARLVEASTGRVVWVGRGSYEGLDLLSALEAVVGSLSRSLARVLPNKRFS